MIKFLAAMFLVLLIGGLGISALVAGAGWLAWRRLRRFPLVAAGRIAVGGLLTLGGHRRCLPTSRKAALRSLRIGRQQRGLRRRIHAAQRSGAYLDEIAALLPRLEAEGRRIRAGLANSAERHKLAQADDHLKTLTELSAAVDGATINSPDDFLTGDARDAALALHLRNAAYAELTTPTKG